MPAAAAGISLFLGNNQEIRLLKMQAKKACVTDGMVHGGAGWLLSSSAIRSEFWGIFMVLGVASCVVVRKEAKKAHTFTVFPRGPFDVAQNTFPGCCLVVVVRPSNTHLLIFGSSILGGKATFFEYA